MATAAQMPERGRRRDDAGTHDGDREQGLAQKAQGLEKRAAPLMAFWTKLNNDWVFDFSAELAYTLLMSIFPILIAILGIGGLILGTVSSDAKQRLITGVANGIANALPKTGTQSMGNAIVVAVNNALNSYTQSAGVLFIFGLVVALFTGSRIFVTLEKQFGVIFRLRGRDPLRQNLMALGMMLLYVVLVPLVLLGSTIPTAIIAALGLDTRDPVLSIGVKLLGVLVGVVAAVVLFGAIYVVVPNRPVKLNEVWRGTLAAAGLLVLYELFFPFYQSNFLKPGHYGAFAGFAIVLLVFFYYFGFILLLGAEVNSWVVGQRQTAAPLEGILHEVQAHNTTRGAAGPTAGDAQEDMQSGKGAAAMRDTDSAIRHLREEHNVTMQPPKFMESSTTGSGYRRQEQGKDAIQPTSDSGKSDDGAGDGSAAEEASPSGSMSATPGESRYAGQQEGLRGKRRSIEREPATTSKSLTPRQRRALGAVAAAAAAVALAPVVHYVVRYVSGADKREDRQAMD